MTKKQIAIANIKENRSWYIYDGKQGVLLDNFELSWVNESIVGCHDFYNFSELSLEQLEEIIKEELIKASYPDSYGGDTTGKRIECGTMVNFENHQRLFYDVWATPQELRRDENEREYHTITDSYYDWTSILRERMEAVAERRGFDYAEEWANARI